MAENGQPDPAPAQYASYSLYRVDPAWRRLPVEERAAHKDAFAEVVEEWRERMGLLA
jgi:chlorite dismutase